MLAVLVIVFLTIIIIIICYQPRGALLVYIVSLYDMLKTMHILADILMLLCRFLHIHKWRTTLLCTFKAKAILICTHYRLVHYKNGWYDNRWCNKKLSIRKTNLIRILHISTWLATKLYAFTNITQQISAQLYTLYYKFVRFFSQQ